MHPAMHSAIDRLAARPRPGSSNFHVAFRALHIAICLLIAPQLCRAAIRVEAYRGEPFGVGRVTVDLSPGASAAPAGDDRFALVEDNDRVLYPVLENKSSRRFLRSLLGIETPLHATFIFMFRGDDPLNLVVYTPAPEKATARPADNAKEFNRLLDDWWKATEDRYQQVFRSAEYPVVVENYLTATWARRLNRDMPAPSRYLFQRIRLSEPWFSQLMANEEYQTQVERDLLLGRFSDADAATIPLPAPTAGEPAGEGAFSADGAPARQAKPAHAPAPPNELPAPASAVPASIEPLASHVPHECFYLRFGNFPNYLWFRDFMRHWQGDLGNMLVNQSVDHNNSERFQQQIAVGETKIARVMGPTVVHDVAIIGLDPYMRDGAAMGILFYANNNPLLKNNLSGQRQDAKNHHPDAVEETVRIANHDVSYFYTPDFRLRSYYAIDGDYHLVANSRRLIERFYQSGAGNNALAASAEFQDCRAAMPLTRDDTIFLFAPAAFFRNLASPHYRVELDRRLRSIGEMRSLSIARLAARAEGRNATTTDDLIAAELLPAGFANRADGSKLIEINTQAAASAGGQAETKQPSPSTVVQRTFARDSLRGEPGWMTPIADVPVDQITSAEARRLADFQRSLQGAVGQFAPICCALKRIDSPAQKGWDRITVDVRVAPYSQMPIARWPNMLGPAAPSRVAPIKGDVVSLEVVLDALGQPVHLFGGLRDFRTPLVVRQGEVAANAPTSEFIRGYIGGWPRPHLIDRFVRIPDGPLDADGITHTQGLFDLWLRRADDFFLFSFKRDVLMEVGPQLAIVQSQRPAQIRLAIDDLSNKQISTAVSGLGYMRARNTSASASRFMNSLTTQLHVPPQNARALAESLTNGRFTCPLGGDYKLISLPVAGEGAGEGQRKLWASTATSPQNRFLLTEIPADYQMPLMNWFRGLSADVARANDELNLHAALDMVHIKVGPPEDPEDAGGGLKLPGLGNLFSGFGAKKDENVKPASATGQSPPARSSSNTCTGTPYEVLSTDQWSTALAFSRQPNHYFFSAARFSFTSRMTFGSDPQSKISTIEFTSTSRQRSATNYAIHPISSHVRTNSVKRQPAPRSHRNKGFELHLGIPIAKRLRRSAKIGRLGR